MKRFFSFVLIFALLFLLGGCKTQKKKFTDYSFDCFDTVTTIIGFEKDKETFNKVCEFIKAELYEYHKLYNIYNSYEGVKNLYTINKEKTVSGVDSKIIDLLNFCKEMHTLTNGETNIAYGSVLKIWHNCRQAGLNDPETAYLPDMSVLDEAAKHTNINNLVIDETTKTVTLLDSEMLLDVGAVAKGYAVECVAKKLESKGIKGYLLNVGGNIKIVGDRPDKETWAIGIENPDGIEDLPYIEYLELNNFSLVTSGNYQRFYTVNGKNYHHIIDTKTNMPSNYFKMVSVICEHSGKADALSTALFCMSFEDGKKLVNSLNGVEAMWVGLNGEKLYSENFLDYRINKEGL